MGNALAPSGLETICERTQYHNEDDGDCEDRKDHLAKGSAWFLFFCHVYSFNLIRNITMNRRLCEMTFDVFCEIGVYSLNGAQVFQRSLTDPIQRTKSG